MLKGTKRLRTTGKADSTARNLVASIDPADLEPTFDLLAAASDQNLSGCETEPLNFHSIPRYYKVAVKRFQRNAHIGSGVKLAQASIVGAAVLHGLQQLRCTPESSRFLDVLEIVEASDKLSMSDELLLDEAIAGFTFTPSDANSGTERWTVRVPVAAKESFYATRNLLRLPVTALASACFAFGLAQQTGVNPEASELMAETLAQLRAALHARAVQIEKLVAVLERES